MSMVKSVRTASLVLLLGVGLTADAGAQAKPAEGGVPNCITAAKWSRDPIPGEDLWASGGPGGAFVAVKTNAGNFALLSLSAAQTLVIESAELFNEAGQVLANKEYLRIPGGATFDLDTGTAASDSTADVRWNTSGGKSLDPVNQAMVYLCRPSDRRSAPR